MDLKLNLLILLTSLLLMVQGQEDFGNGFKTLYPCKGNKNIFYKYSKDQPTEKEMIFFVYINEVLPAKTVVNITLILPTELSLSDPGAELSITREEVIDVVLFEKQKNLNFSLTTIDKKTPYVTSVLIDKVEKCINPILERDEVGKVPVPNLLTNRIGVTSSISCGRPKVIATQLIYGGHPTKPGDWPWHVALSRLDPQSPPEYICGGSLISSSMILTAAHCVTESGEPLVPTRLLVTLGKYNLYDKDTTAQDRRVYSIIVHDKFDHISLANDIALVQLKTEVNYTNYIQPVCLWDSYIIPRLPQNNIIGTVVGWGLNQSYNLSPELMKLSMPKINDLQCIKTNELFFSKALNGKNFCAGYHNDTDPRSACNGDSGGGFTVFAPDTAGDTSENAPGSWHIRGITSQAVALGSVNCDPTQYSVFTDVSLFLDWIQNYL